MWLRNGEQVAQYGSEKLEKQYLSFCPIVDMGVGDTI